MSVDALKLKTVDARRLGDNLIIEHTKMSVYDPAGKVLVTDKVMMLWKQEDGDWKMNWDTWNVGGW